MTSFYQDKKVLVTGGGGFIGSHLVERLVEAGAKVRVAQRTRSGSNLASVIGRIEFIPADLLKLDECLKATKGAEIVFNLAAKVGGVQYNISHSGTMFFANSTLALNMLEAARAEGVERFMLTSSTCVYPPDAPVPNVEEDGFVSDPDKSNLGYGWAKRASELGAQFFAGEFGMNIAIVRPANIYGPRDNFDPTTSHVVPGLIRRVFESEGSIDVWGSGNQTRAFVYVKDVADAMMLVTEKYAVADPLNIGTDEEVTIRELIELIIKTGGKELALKFDTSKPEGLTRKAAAISKIKEKLDWSPSYSLAEGLKETIKWYRQAYLSGN